MSCKELNAYSRLPHAIVAARGSTLELSDGREVLDLYGGHCVNTLGAGDVGLLRAMTDQWHAASFVTNLVDHDSRARFLAAFGSGLPPGDWRVFLSNSGAEANENALKAALGASGRAAVVCFEGAFHGRTAAASAVSDVARQAYPQSPFEVRRVPFGDIEAARAAIDGSVGAVILEPIQALAGVRTPEREFLSALGAACDAHGAFLIFDEVQTGNGRLGVPWASQHFGVLPDAFTTAKGAAGGLPIGVTVLGDELAAKVPDKLFGSTFGGGPTVLAAATEVAQRVGAPGFLERVQQVSARIQGAAKESPIVEVRGVGLLLGLALEPGTTARAVRDALLAEGVLVGLCNDPAVVRITPPLTLGLREAERFGRALASLPQALGVAL